MRLVPVPLFFNADPLGAIENAALSSKTTHGHAEAVDACRYFAGLIVGAVEGRTRDELLAPHFTPVEGLWDREPLAHAIAHVAGGSFLREEPPIIRGSGYVTRSLEAALWAFGKSTCFEDGALLAVNLGEDADTTGAVYGQIAGAFYGVESIPERWRSKLAKLDVLELFAKRLYYAAEART
jgi:ADP-ribosylglycohydrolase